MVFLVFSFVGNDKADDVPFMLLLFFVFSRRDASPPGRPTGTPASAGARRPAVCIIAIIIISPTRSIVRFFFPITLSLLTCEKKKSKWKREFVLFFSPVASRSQIVLCFFFRTGKSIEKNHFHKTKLSHRLSYVSLTRLVNTRKETKEKAALDASAPILKRWLFCFKKQSEGTRRLSRHT